ncbi:hypothetical protein F3Y22_tig00111342pilonHSYRG00134 [Hibiscus syriacus]|uniref:Uncharacterized protein n=1 Tax=Hibiscus syriacus TaxID=106335 RepID=A0A6A2YP63_HIBSY|nr:hypothetical protein F3Y22_tig00111342pilonHSYRG00134 [Hibiscus syriacus]
MNQWISWHQHRNHCCPPRIQRQRSTGNRREVAVRPILAKVSRHFYRVARVYVSQKFQKRAVWEDILTSLTSINERARDSRSKFLLTSRNKQIVSHADRRGLLYELQCLDDEKSWELFRLIAFPERDYKESIIHVEKEELGKEMVHRCAGLPLAIIVLRHFGYQEFKGFVSSEKVEGKMMEDVAEGWLVELVERYMVQVGERDPIGKIKTCRRHDLTRDLCLSMAMKESFGGIIGDPSYSPTGRIAAHRSIAFRCTKSPPLRSILFFRNATDDSALDRLITIAIHCCVFIYAVKRRDLGHPCTILNCLESGVSSI